MNDQINLKTLKNRSEEFSFMDLECQKIDIEWENLTVKAFNKTKVRTNTKKHTSIEENIILNDISGNIRHNTFTAILGPSGSGKTTLLNFLSSRLSHKLQVSANIKINSRDVKDIDSLGSLLSYVQQDDVLLSTMTPREALLFAANLRLNLSQHEKIERVEKIIEELDILDCADTRIGSDELRGISGGERKRTSIGVELITNPSLMLLDEPTTGLDSATALNVINVIKNLAKGGRNVVSTIHQPSSDMFSQFDNLILLTRGSIIYQGPSKNTVKYFNKIGYICPKYANPADFFLEIMNRNGLLLEKAKKNNSRISTVDEKELESDFQQRLDHLIISYNESSIAMPSEESIVSEQIKNNEDFHTNWLNQFTLILKRAIQNEFRDRAYIKLKLIQIILSALIVSALYHKMGQGFDGIQDRIGVLFLLASMSGFLSITGSLGTFSQERPIFIRERLSKSYSSSAYFWARACSELPLLLIKPIILISIVYGTIGLNNVDLNKYLTAVVFHILAWLAGSGYGLFMSTVISRIEVAMALVPALVVPFLIFTGFFVNQNAIPILFKPFEYFSIFKWTFQGTAINEFTGLHLSCSPACKPLHDLEFQQDLTGCLLGLAGIGFLFRILAYVGLVKVSTPKRARISRV